MPRLLTIACLCLTACATHPLWDSTWKSINVRAFIDDPNQLARAWMAATGREIPATAA
ncbi:MAG: hypothetical protein WCO94_03500 [Verrucomicrobiota bacterium]